MGEELAKGYVRRTPELAVSSLRFTWVLTEENARVARSRRERGEAASDGALWTWVDVRDAAAACRLALERKQAGHEAFYIAAPEIYLATPIETLLARHFPGDYPVAPQVRGSLSPVDCSKARRLLGWQARRKLDGSERA